MRAPAFTSLGKEVLLNGEHYADARDPAAAERIAAGLAVLNALDMLRSVEAARPIAQVLK